MLDTIFSIKMVGRDMWRNFRVVFGESGMNQQTFMVFRYIFKRTRVRKKIVALLEIDSGVTDNNVKLSENIMEKNELWNLEGDNIGTMWSLRATMIRSVDRKCV